MIKFEKIRTLTELFSKARRKYNKSDTFKQRVVFTKYYKECRIKDHLIIYESNHGRSMNDNPYAIFDYLVNHEEFKNYTHVWALNEEDSYYAKKYAKNPRISFVKVHSKEYIKCLAQAKYLINNTTFPFYFQKKPDQVYLNTWHGTPLKTLGKDMKGSLGQHKNIQRNFLHTTYLLSPNKFTTDILIDSHDLRGIYQGEVIEEGYPRIDLTKKTDASIFRNTILNQVVQLDPNKKIILYAPTWRGEVGDVNQIKDEIVSKIKELNNKIPGEYQLLLKVHTLIYKQFKEDEELENICIPDWVDTNELLAAVDVLITDYSSIFFDYFVTKKPILYFVFDHEAYKEARGIYFKLEDLPGPLCYTSDDVANAIESLDEVIKKYEDRYEEYRQNYCSGDIINESVTEKIVNVVFNKKYDTVNMFKVTEPQKKNILIYPGGIYNNGITASFINLTENIDYNKYNLIILDKGFYNAEATANMLKINENTKVLYRSGDSMNLTIFEWVKHKYLMKEGFHGRASKYFKPEVFFKRESQRLLGDSKIDVAIDFSGYVPFWAYLIAYGDFEIKSIYQHSNMLAETKKVIDGKYKHKKRLFHVFSAYKYFTNVVSVGKETKKLNAKELARYIAPEKSVFIPNSISALKIKEQSVQEYEVVEALEDKKFFLTTNENEFGKLTITGIDEPQTDAINFITVGRLSPEKDQEKLILAFSNVLKGHPNLNLKLYIVGTGTLRDQLHSLAKQLNLINNIIFTEQLSNPFYLINKCDCFILSSNHEGQPMVLLEALVLKKPIIATDIAGSRSVLGKEYGTLVPNNVKGLAQGLDNFITHYKNGTAVNEKEFDYERYNRKSMKKFYKIACGEK